MKGRLVSAPDVSIKLAALRPYMVILPQLVILVDPSHVAVVEGHLAVYVILEANKMMVNVEAPALLQYFGLP